MGAGRPGFALILVLLATAGVFALAMQSAVSMRTTVVEATLFQERAVAERGARGAAVLVLTGLVTARDPGADDPLADGSGGSSGPGGEEEPERELPPLVRAMLEAAGEEIEEGLDEELEAHDEEVERLADAGGVAQRSRSGGSLRVLRDVGLPDEVMEVRLEGDPRVYRVRVRDAAGGLNINAASAEQIARFAWALGADALTAEAVADQVVDWRDEDGFVRPRGAEAEAHARRGVVPRNAPMRAREELLYLPAVSAALYRRMAPMVTLAGDGRVDVNSAPRAVLSSVEGLGARDVDRLIAARREGPLDRARLEQLLPAGSRETMEMLRVSPSNVLRLEIEAVGDSVQRFEGLAIMGKGGIQSLGIRAAGYGGADEEEG